MLEFAELRSCAEQPCKNKGTCLETWDSYKCSCLAAFTGADCEEKLRSCAQHPCKNKGTCLDTWDSYNCSCLAAFTGADCEESKNICSASCRHLVYCGLKKPQFVEVHSCAKQPCKNKGTCLDTWDSYNCSCSAAFTGADCEESKNNHSASRCFILCFG
ncbi:unnamed protein product [Soboliphyme baturini]|uniref:EGF-like domain-containing protein n=1 Tax=Soboliphyme baturini TaxID=241478 RepID=A0A183J9F4_9BILA|nr:unnamed protein product [Soboliphyme baturini]